MSLTLTPAVLERGAFSYCCSQHIPASSENLLRSTVFILYHQVKLCVSSSVQIPLQATNYVFSTALYRLREHLFGRKNEKKKRKKPHKTTTPPKKSKNFSHLELSMVFRCSFNSITSYFLCCNVQIYTIPTQLLKSFQF